MARRKKGFDLTLDPETRTGIAVVFLVAISILGFLAMFQLAGVFGRALDDASSYVFGWDRLFVYCFLLAWAYYLHAPDKLTLRFLNVVGMFLFFLTLNPFVHLMTFPQGTKASDLTLQIAGGKLGESLAVPFVNFLGLFGAASLLLALFVVSLLLIFNTNLRQVLFFTRWIWKGLAYLGKQIKDPIKRGMDERAKRLEEEKLKAQPTLASIPLHQTVQGAASVRPTAPAPSVTVEEMDEADETDEDEEEEVDEPDEVIIPAKPRKSYPRIDIPLDLLDRRDQKPTSGDINHNKEVIRRTLENFGIPVEMADVAVGPTVTQFALKPAEGIKLSRITGLHNDLALALAAHPIRIEAPIPGKAQVGIEVPNLSVATVGLRELLESREFRERKSPLTFALGKDVSGKPWNADIGRMPHCLVAGATGSGKSVCLNTIIVSLLYTNGPDDLKLIMVDPKRVELQVYNGVPHLITPVITKVADTINALKWALREMDRRYDLLSTIKARDLATYNERAEEKLPFIVILIDELADLMATSSAEIEGPIVRLAQMSRAVGIHLILATQRPSVNVITGLIKANIPARIAFAVASAIDSRTILDQQGAEKLLGRGDMLFSTAEMSSMKRVQGGYISDTEITRVVEYIKSKYEPAEYDPAVIERENNVGTSSSNGGGSDSEDSDPMILMAKDEILRAGKASASLLQRRLKVGYARAARLLDLLEQQGFIGPADGAKPREILQAQSSKKPDQIPLPLPEADEEVSDEEVEETE